MMMMIGHPPPTVDIQPWDYPNLEDPAVQINSPHIHTVSGSPAPGSSQYDAALAALQRYLPSNKDDVIHSSEYDDFDVPVDAFSCDDFRMFEFKVRKCARARSHDWTECPFAHPGEKARRRDPRKFHYSGSACPDFRRGACKRGDGCEYAHGVFECWLHPARYRTQPCKDGTLCRRRVCFFAHTPEQLRVLPYNSAGGFSPDESPTGTSHDPFFLIGSSPKSAMYSPPSSPTTLTPPLSPGGSRMSQLTESMRDMHLNKMKLGLGMGLSLSPPSWGGSGYGSPTGRPGFMSLPTTPIRAVARRGIHPFEGWESSLKEEPAMERVESGRALRERIYAKLGRENSLDRRVDSLSEAPDFDWVSDLVK